MPSLHCWVRPQQKQSHTYTGCSYCRDARHTVGTATEKTSCNHQQYHCLKTQTDKKRVDVPISKAAFFNEKNFLINAGELSQYLIFLKEIFDIFSVL